MYYYAECRGPTETTFLLKTQVGTNALLRAEFSSKFQNPEIVSFVFTQVWSKVNIFP
jgi:hypothetical protein